MHGKHSAFEYSQTMFWNDILSSFYLPAFLSYLYYNNLILKLGKIEYVRHIIFLGALEILKYMFYANSKGSPLLKSSTRIAFKSTVACSVSFLVVYVVAVLFGAPAFSGFEETGMFSLIVTVVTALPVSLHLGLSNTLRMFLSITSSEGIETQKLFLLKVRLALLGAWLGAIVIPLDWKRPWQDWPIPCSLGTVLGYMVANWLCVIIQFGSRGSSNRKSGKYAL